MGDVYQFNKVKLFCGFIYQEADRYQKVKEDLIRYFSRIDSESKQFKFDITSYYYKEMNHPLFRRFLSFNELIAPDRLPEIKLITNELEINNARAGKRTVNLDPGYLSSGSIIIATTKNYNHRVPLKDGIYAHMEYIIKKKEIIPLEWTYPDFRLVEYMNYFTSLRDLYKKNLNEKK